MCACMCHLANDVGVDRSFTAHQNTHHIYESLACGNVHSRHPEFLFESMDTLWWGGDMSCVEPRCCERNPTYLPLNRRSSVHG